MDGKHRPRPATGARGQGQGHEDDLGAESVRATSSHPGRTGGTLVVEEGRHPTPRRSAWAIRPPARHGRWGTGAASSQWWPARSGAKGAPPGRHCSRYFPEEGPVEWSWARFLHTQRSGDRGGGHQEGADWPRTATCRTAWSPGPGKPPLTTTRPTGPLGAVRCYIRGPRRWDPETGSGGRAEKPVRRSTDCGRPDNYTHDRRRARLLGRG